MKVVSFGDSACERTRRYLDSYVNNELSVETSHEVLRHLETCTSCSVELAELTKLRSLVKRAVRNDAAPGALRARVRADLSSPRPSRRWVLAAGSAAAATLVGTASLRLSRERDVPPRAEEESYMATLEPRITPVMWTGLQDHIHCAVFRKYPQNPPSHEQMIADIGPYSDLIPIVRSKVPSRYRLEQAHRCSFRQRQYVHMIFREKGLFTEARLISLVVTRKHRGETIDTGAGHPPNGSVEAFQMAAFETSDYLGWIISNLPAAGNQEIAAAVNPAVREFLTRTRAGVSRLWNPRA